MRNGLAILTLALSMTLPIGCKNSLVDPLGFGPKSNDGNNIAVTTPTYKLATNPSEQYAAGFPKEQLIYFIDQVAPGGDVNVEESVTFGAYKLSGSADQTLDITWKFDDGSTATGNSTIKTFSAEGETSVTLSVGNSYFTGGSYVKEFKKTFTVKPKNP